MNDYLMRNENALYLLNLVHSVHSWKKKEKKERKKNWSSIEVNLGFPDHLWSFVSIIQ